LPVAAKIDSSTLAQIDRVHRLRGMRNKIRRMNVQQLMD
jgi:hypothetical protein